MPGSCGLRSRHFNQRPPCGGRQCPHDLVLPNFRISTNAPLAGGDPSPLRVTYFPVISTNAPLAGGDLSMFLMVSVSLYFNQRPPCGGRRIWTGLTTAGMFLFQPTPPLRGATRAESIWTASQNISTNAPLAGGDVRRCRPRWRGRNFNQRPPCGGRPNAICVGHISQTISTNAPLAGGDSPYSFLLPRDNDFNQRPPCGGRLGSAILLLFSYRFQPTPPLRGATKIRRSNSS